MMKAKLIPFEPCLTLLTNKDIFRRVILERENNLNLEPFFRTSYIGENLDYILQHSITIKDVRDYIFQFKIALIELSNNLFDKNQKIKDIEIYKNVTSYIEQNILFITYLLFNKYPNFKIYEEVSFHNIPNFLGETYETHLHGEVALRFNDLLEFLIQNIDPIIENLKKISKNTKKTEIVDYINDLIYISNMDCLEISDYYPNFYKIFNRKIIKKEKYFTKFFSYKDLLSKAISYILSFDKNHSYKEEEIISYIAYTYLILAINNLHRSSIDTTTYKGLKFFSEESFRSPIRKAFTMYSSLDIRKAQKAQHIFRKFFCSFRNTKGYEIRISLEKEQLRRWSQIYINKWRKQDKSIKYGIILHYKKAGSYKKFLKINKLYKNIFEETKKICEVFKKDENLGRYIIGIDAASIELWTPPWVFATAFKFWRHFVQYNVSFFKEKKLGFTFHAGEDFVDIITGLKHIYEAIYFLDLRQGDRIGHGLAAGILVDRYSLKYTVISVYPIYYFFNLLWLNHLTLQYPTKFIEFKDKIYMEIIRFLEKPIVGNQNLLKELEDLFRNPNYSYTDQYEFQFFLAKFYENLGYDPFNISNSNNFENLWRKASKSNLKHEESEKLFINVFNNIFEYFKKSDLFMNQKVKLVPIFEEDSNFSFDEQVEILNLIQDIVMEELIKREIVIEVCPTSNVYLSGLRSYKDHPILNKWKTEVESGNLKLTINTDNPLIGNTNLLLEYLLIHNNLVPDKNNSILKNIVKFSKEYTFLKHLKEG